MTRRRMLRQLMRDQRGLVVPGAYDGVSAKLVERGIPCLFTSGKAPSFPIPDLALGCLVKPFTEEDLVRALKAAEELAKQGIEAEVINLRSLRPLDTATIIESVKKTSRVVSVEEGWPYAGIGAEVVMQVVEGCFDWLDAPPVRVHGADVPLPYAANLEKLALPQPGWIVDAAKKTMGT